MPVAPYKCTSCRQKYIYSGPNRGIRASSYRTRLDASASLRCLQRPPGVGPVLGWPSPGAKYRAARSGQRQRNLLNGSQAKKRACRGPSVVRTERPGTHASGFPAAREATGPPQSPPRPTGSARLPHLVDLVRENVAFEHPLRHGLHLVQPGVAPVPGLEQRG